MGIEPTPSAWKAEVLPLNYTRLSLWELSQHSLKNSFVNEMVVGEGFEPSKAVPADLQSAPFGRSGIPPAKTTSRAFCVKAKRLSSNGAGSGNRTHDLPLTRRLHYRCAMPATGRAFYDSSLTRATPPFPIHSNMRSSPSSTKVARR